MRDWLRDCDCDCELPEDPPSAEREMLADVSMLWLTSNNSLPSWRLSEPSDHRIIRLFDCFRYRTPV